MIFREKADSLFDDLAFSLDVKMTFFSSRMEPVNRGRYNRVSPYCGFIQDRMGLKESCREQDRINCLRARREGRSFLCRCHGGLYEGVVPVAVDGTVLGYGFMGQVRLDEKPPENLMEKIVLSGEEREAWREAFNRRPLFSREKLQSSLRLFEHLLSHMTDKNMVALRGNLLVEKAWQYLERDPGGNGTLSGAAAFAGCRPETLSRLFKKQTGRSFKETQLELKFREAERLMISRPELSLSRISYELGFSEPAYFSRIYKKYRGLSPRQSAERLRKEPS